MKKLSLALVFAFIATFSQAQFVPQGMNYQAVARNLSGEVLANQPVSLKIELYNGPQASPEVFYSETHSVRTNQLGLFTLIIGSGTPVTGTFSKVPWSTEEVWVGISIKDKSQSKFALISSSKLLAVPYAFHAGTAAEIVGGKSGVANRTSEGPLGANDSSETKIVGGDYITVTGMGNSVNPYIVKANIDSMPASTLGQVIDNGNTTEGKIVFKKNDDNFLEAHPGNYDANNKRGAFSMAIKEFPGVNGVGNRSNVVGSFWGYNTTPGGGQAIPGEASYRFAGETFYDVGGQKMMEFHLPEMYTNSGMGVRPFSMYIDRESGVGAANFQMHQFNFKKVENADIDWMRIRNDASIVRLEMQPENGGSSYIELNGRGSNGRGGFYNTKSFMVSEGNGLSFVTSFGGFSFNSTVGVEGMLTSKGIYSNNNNPNPNSIAHSFQGNRANNRLFVVGDDAYSEKFYITPSSVMSSLDFISYGNFALGKAIHPIGGADLNFRFNMTGNGAKLNFITDAGGYVAAQVSTAGLFAKTIQTDKPGLAEGAGKLKVGNVVTATVKDVTSKYLKIEIDGVNYKIALVD